jgi:hypothetical protein
MADVQPILNFTHTLLNMLCVTAAKDVVIWCLNSIMMSTCPADQQMTLIT